VADITEGDFVLLGIFGALEERISPRAIYDTGYFVKNPVEFGTAMQAQLWLNEVINVYYKRKGDEDPHPPHDHNYQEGPDGGTDWREDPEASV